MFDKEYKAPPKKSIYREGQQTPQNIPERSEINPFRGDREDNSIAYINIIIFSVIGVAVIAVLAFYFISKNKNTSVPIVKPDNNLEQDATSSNSFVFDETEGNGGRNGNGGNNSDFRAEYLTFGSYYKPQKIDYDPTIEKYELPQNIKSDVLNYFDFSRKINIDDYIDDLNNDGFAIMQNPYGKTANNFFDVYRLLISKEVPIIVTSDFVYYYYQNILKQIYDDIRKDVFYNNFWDFNYSLYTIALTRYKKRLAEVGLANDPILEAQRLETAFFAVALDLLAPDENQINPEDISDSNKFTQADADMYNYDIHESIKAEVSKEIAYINRSKDINKSPIFLYDINYGKFSVPVNIKNNAKLRNFHLAVEWTRSQFPLYYQSEECPDCQLDYNDWLINLIAANYITKDLSDNQDIKNQWAVIYKFISFFSGLRSDLTYLNYNESLIKLFGENYAVESIFSPESENFDNDLNNFVDMIKSYEFNPLEGGVDRQYINNRTSIGMRILQDPYWPNDYILNSLTGADMNANLEKNQKTTYFTACARKGGLAYRCQGTALDLINIFQPIKNYKYFTDNSNYTNYENKVEDIREVFSKYDAHTWNNNVYWLTLDINKNIIDRNQINLPYFIDNNNWAIKKQYNTYLGAWVNLHLDRDDWRVYSNKKNDVNFNILECNQYNIIEPETNLFNDLIARNNMLNDVLDALNISKDTNAATLAIKDVNIKLESLLAISKKELLGEDFIEDDCNFMVDFVSNYDISKEAGKSYGINFSNKRINESISGIKLLLFVYEKDGQRILAIGPIFNYKEG